MCETLQKLGVKFLTVEEAGPTHCPSNMRRFFGAYHPGGRFRSFPHMPMVTHHVENLAGDITEKKALANVCAGEKVFEETPGDAAALRRANRRLKMVMALASIFPKTSWIANKKTRKKNA